MGYDGGINLYAYVGNNPVNESDPSGKWAIIVAGVFVGLGVLCLLNPRCRYAVSTGLGLAAPSGGGDIAGFCDPSIACAAVIAAANSNIQNAINHQINDPDNPHWQAVIDENNAKIEACKRDNATGFSYSSPSSGLMAPQ